MSNRLITMVRFFTLFIVASFWVLWPTFLPAHVLQNDSTRIQSLVSAGDMHYSQYDNGRAIEFYRMAHRLDSASYHVLTRMSRALNEYGMDLSAADQRKEAKAIFEEAIHHAEQMRVLFPDSARSFFHLAYSKGRFALFQGGIQKVQLGQELEVLFQQGLALDSLDIDLLTAYGVFSREAASLGWVERTVAKALFGPVPDGSKEQAVKLLKQALSIDSNLHLAHYELAITYISMGKNEKAIPHLEQAKNLRPQTSLDVRNRRLATRMLERLGGVSMQ